MIPLRGKLFCAMAWTCLFLAGLAGCKAKADNPQAATSRPPFMSTVATAPPQPADDAPPPDNTGGFDGKRAFAHVAKQVAFGPRPAGSAALAQTQDYIVAELKSYGCMVETDAFSADTPDGRLPMKNILVKIPGSSPGIILLGTHYDTKRLDRKSTRLNSSHEWSSYAVFCLKKKKETSAARRCRENARKKQLRTR